MSISSVNYECLESATFDAEKIPIQYRFKTGEKISLMLGLSDGEPRVELYMPGGEFWSIERCASEQEARDKYDKYLTQLGQGYHVHITTKGIEIVEPK